MKKALSTLLMMIVALLATFSATGSVYASNTENQTTMPSEMIDFDHPRVHRLVSIWLTEANATTDEEKIAVFFRKSIQAIYDRKQRDSYLASISAGKDAITKLSLIEEKTFLECFDEMYAYEYMNAPQPKWLCGDYARFLVGLARSVGISGYIENGNATAINRRNGSIVGSTLHAWAILYPNGTKKLYDPSSIAFGYSMSPSSLYFLDYQSSGAYRETHLAGTKDWNPVPFPAPTANQYRDASVTFFRASNQLQQTNLHTTAILNDENWFLPLSDIMLAQKDTISEKPEQHISLTVSGDSIQRISMSPGTYSDTWQNSFTKTPTAQRLQNLYIGKIRSNVEAILVDGRIFVSAYPMLEILDIPYSVDILDIPRNNITVSVESVYTINATVTAADGTQNIIPATVIKRNNETFIPATTVGSILGLNVTWQNDQVTFQPGAEINPTGRILFDTSPKFVRQTQGFITDGPKTSQTFEVLLVEGTSFVNYDTVSKIAWEQFNID